MLPLVFEYNDGFPADFEILLSAPRGNNAVGASPSSSSSSEESSEIDVASLCSTVEAPESDDVSEAVDGSYSCFKGEDDLLCLAWLCSRFGVLFESKLGVVGDASGLGLDGVGRFLLNLLGELGRRLSGGDIHAGSSSGCISGFIVGLADRALGINGRSVEGVDDSKRRLDGRELSFTSAAISGCDESDLLDSILSAILLVGDDVGECLDI